jgi:Asp-tRNA(Asn)/Glu-tRNA(Gln) amidotransferase A subunit family amidase
MPHHLTLVQMAEQIRTRKLSPVELVTAHLEQIALHNPKLNAFVSIFAEQALEAAKQAEGQSPAGPLHGVPVTIKDSFDVAGEPTLCGSRYRLHHRAATDSTAAARFRAAGAIPLGKTNCPEFLANYETDNFTTGRTNNPWDLTRTPGGSSGGESAAIASFMSAGGIGSDGGGSVRIPAHFTGIAALKPTPGRVSAAGHYPKICHPGGLLGVAGPMARNAADLRILFSVLAGYDPADPFAAPVPLRDPNLSNIRIGVAEQFYNVPVQEPIRKAVRKAAAALTQLKFAVEEFTPKGLERSPNLWWFFFGELPAPFTREIIAAGPEQAHWTGTEFVNSISREPISARTLVENLAARDAMRASLLRQMEDYPVLLMPPCGVTAFHHRERRWETATKSIGLFQAMMPVTPFNLLGLPSVVIPFDLTPDGLPVGIQLIGRPYEEEMLLELAVRLEETAPGISPSGY